MINIAICDDDIVMTGKMETILYDIAKRSFIQIDIDVFWDGKELADSVERGNYFDIIFLDIEMSCEDGITAAKRIREKDKDVLIIYVTSHENYMRESFFVRPFRFLTKPIKIEQLETCFREAHEEINSGDSYFRYNYQRISYKIPIRNILYFESRKRKIYVTTENEIFEFYGKLNEVENSLLGCKVAFLRVHQSFLVNYRHVEGLAYDFVIMDSGKKISISEDRRKMISKQYCEIEGAFYAER